MLSKFNNIANFCLSFAGTTPQIIVKTITAIFFISLLKFLFIWLKTFWFSKKLKIVKTPRAIERLAKKNDLIGQVKIFADSKPLAFCLGFIYPKIYLSTTLTKLMNENELEVVMLHEKYHLVNKDNILLIFTSIFKNFLFFLPITFDIIDGLVKYREAEADRYGIRKLRSDAAISSAFKKLLKFNSTNTFVFNYLASFTNTQTLEYRIKSLTGKKTFVISLKIRHIVLSFISIITFFSFFFPPRQISEAHQNEYPMICLKGHNCHTSCT